MSARIAWHETYRFIRADGEVPWDEATMRRDLKYPAIEAMTRLSRGALALSMTRRYHSKLLDLAVTRA